MNIRPISLLPLLLLVLSVSAWADPGGVDGAGFSNDNRYLVTIGGERTVRLHDGNTGKLLRTVRAPGEASTWFSFSPDSGWEEPNNLYSLSVAGDVAVCCSSDDNIFWWKLPSLELIATGSSTYGAGAMAVSANGEKAVCISTSTRYLDSSIQLLELVEGSVHGLDLPDLPPPDSSSSYGAPQLSPDGNWAVAWTGDGYQLWDISSRIPVSVSAENIQNPILGRFHLYDFGSSGLDVYTHGSLQSPIRTFSCRNMVWAQVSHDETRLICRTAEGLEVWDLTHEGPPVEWRVPAERLTVSPDGRRALVWGEKTLTAFDIDTRKALFKLPLTGKLN